MVALLGKRKKKSHKPNQKKKKKSHKPNHYLNIQQHDHWVKQKCIFVL